MALFGNKDRENELTGQLATALEQAQRLTQKNHEHEQSIRQYETNLIQIRGTLEERNNLLAQHTQTAKDQQERNTILEEEVKRLLTTLERIRETAERDTSARAKLPVAEAELHKRILRTALAAADLLHKIHAFSEERPYLREPESSPNGQYRDRKEEFHSGGNYSEAQREIMRRRKISGIVTGDSIIAELTVHLQDSMKELQQLSALQEQRTESERAWIAVDTIAQASMRTYGHFAQELHWDDPRIKELVLPRELVDAMRANNLTEAHVETLTIQMAKIFANIINRLGMMRTVATNGFLEVVYGDAGLQLEKTVENDVRDIHAELANIIKGSEALIEAIQLEENNDLHKLCVSLGDGIIAELNAAQKTIAQMRASI